MKELFLLTVKSVPLKHFHKANCWIGFLFLIAQWGTKGADDMGLTMVTL